jgi:hypothetical protein
MQAINLADTPLLKAVFDLRVTEGSRRRNDGGEDVWEEMGVTALREDLSNRSNVSDVDRGLY